MIDAALPNPAMADATRPGGPPSFSLPPLSYVPADLDVDDWAAVEPLFAELAERPLSNATAIERWLTDWSELTSVLSEARATRYVAKSRDTTDAAAKERYTRFIRAVAPEIKPWQQRLRVRLVEAAGEAGAQALGAERYGVLLRNFTADVESYRVANVPLETEAELIAQRYGDLTSRMTVEFQGETRTLPQLARFLEVSDRAVRKDAWKATAARRLDDRDELEEIFDALLRLRTQQAHNAGHADFRAYAFVTKHRFDYTPADCERFHEAVESVVVPHLRARHERRQETLRVKVLRPWDLDVPIGEAPPLRPFATGAELIERARTIFDRLCPALGEQHQALSDAGLFDVESRFGKEPGGYSYTLDRRRVPFVFMNAAGRQRDVRTMLHESGHAFHALACRDEPLIWYRSAPMEFAEVASMSMELLGLEHLDVYYGDDAVIRRARQEQFDGILSLFAWVATIDAFQHFIYTHPEHTPQERVACWRRLSERFGGCDDWSGLERERDYAWHRQMHLFRAPFYYIEYGIAQLGALAIWHQARTDLEGALARYRAALALGGSRPLPELFAATGTRFGLDAETIAPLIEAVAAELEALDAE